MQLTNELAIRICTDMSVGLALVGPDNKISWANDFFCGMVDYKEGELKSINITDVMLEQFIPKFDTLQKQLVAGSLTSYSMVNAFKKNGDTAKWRRIVYGSQTIQRHPIKGDFEYYVLLFIPFDGTNETWLPDLESLLNLWSKHYKLILLLISTIIGLVTGSTQLTSGSSNLEQRLQQLEKLIQSSSDSGSSSESPSDGSPVQP